MVAGPGNDGSARPRLTTEVHTASHPSATRVIPEREWTGWTAGGIVRAAGAWALVALAIAWAVH
ncbi:MAG: hypothetical protein CVU56_17155 [Deltaproteobacteria bacterium HGW-Deltaproteobacteria-14]|nr:MAG: hypothetical protein CVU56_17155 [Deltaproteobacteria bacterium HGW-Deltaproteobacteria-14]